MASSRFFSTVLIGALLLSACGGGIPADDADAAAEPAAAAVASTDASTVSSESHAQSPYVTEVKVLGEFKDRYGFVRKYVQVAPGLSDAQLIDLAQRLHALEPETWFWMLDDDAQAEKMMEALPRTAEGDFSGYPREWVEQHTPAHIQMEIMPGGGRRWVLAKGHGSAGLAILGTSED